MPITDTNFGKSQKELLEQQMNELMKNVKQKDETYDELAVVILAAGLGKRMKSPDKPKVMFEINGKPMIEYVISIAQKLNPKIIVPIVGHHRELVIDYLRNKGYENIKYAIQAEQLGTGHAIMQTEDVLKDFHGDVLILSGDVPLLRLETVEALVNEHRKSGNDATLLTTKFKNPHGYGRIVRDDKNNFVKIVEEKDTSESEKRINEINAAIYVVKSDLLFDAVKKVTPENNQNEYYLTDIFHFIPKEKVGTFVTNDELEVTGVNSIEQLKEMEEKIINN